MARLLLDKGAEVDRLENGRTLFVVAAPDGLLDDVDDDGATPAPASCCWRKAPTCTRPPTSNATATPTVDIDVVRLLFEWRCCIDREDEDGDTPLADAENEDHSDIVALLEEHQK